MKKTLCSLLLLPALLLTLCLPIHAADIPPIQKMTSILQLIEDTALYYDPSVINDDLRQDLSRRLEADPSLLDPLMRDLLSDLDVHSMYLPAGTYAEAFGDPEGYVGIGITMEQTDSAIRVKAIDPIGPAAHTGLQIGDLLTAVDGISVTSNDLSAAAALIRGESGTPVSISIRRGTLDMTFSMVRTPIVQPMLSGFTPEENIYYMDLERFSGDTLEDEFRYYLLEATRLQSKVLILDLRGNPGGDLDLVTAMLNRLIPDKTPYFTVAGRDDGNDNDYVFHAHGRGPRFNKILLLTDDGTASAAEIMTAALCDLGYGLSVGETTYGKARGQQHFLYPDGSAAVITTIRLIPPSGIDYEGAGLTPDYPVTDHMVRHPAASCQPLDFRYLGQGDTSRKTVLLQNALRAMGYLTCPEETFGPHTLDALNRFRKDCGLGPKTYLNAESVIRINASLEALADRQVPADVPLDTALRLARRYLHEPLLYTADKYGQFENLH